MSRQESARVQPGAGLLSTGKYQRSRPIERHNGTGAPLPRI